MGLWSWRLSAAAARSRPKLLNSPTLKLPNPSTVSGAGFWSPFRTSALLLAAENVAQIGKQAAVGQEDLRQVDRRQIESGLQAGADNRDVDAGVPQYAEDVHNLVVHVELIEQSAAHRKRDHQIECVIETD